MSRYRRGSICVVLGGLIFAAGGSAQGQPSNLDDVVVFARDQVRLNRSSRQTGGQILVNEPDGVVIAHPRFQQVPDLAPDLITNALRVVGYALADGPQIFNLFTNSIDDPNGGLVVAGTQTTPIGFTLPLFPFPSPPTVTPGTTDILVRRINSPVTLLPGDYGNVRVSTGGVLYLTGGTYNIASLRVGGRGLLLANAGVTLNVQQKVRFGGRSNFGPSDPSMNGRCVVLNTASSRTVSFGQYSDVTAAVTAPSAQMRLGRLGTYRGNFTAKRVTVGRSTVLTTLPPLTEACP